MQEQRGGQSKKKNYDRREKNIDIYKKRQTNNIGVLQPCKNIFHARRKAKFDKSTWSPYVQ